MRVDVFVLVVMHIRVAKVITLGFLKLNFINKDYSFEKIDKGKMEVGNF